MNLNPIFNPYWGPGPARPIRIEALIYKPQLESMLSEAHAKNGLNQTVLSDYPSLQTVALLIPPSFGLDVSDG